VSDPLKSPILPDSPRGDAICIERGAAKRHECDSAVEAVTYEGSPEAVALMPRS